MKKTETLIIDLPKIEQIMYYASGDAVIGREPSSRRWGLKTKFLPKEWPCGSEAEEIYEDAYFAYGGAEEDKELLVSKWGYMFGDFGEPIKMKEAA